MLYNLAITINQQGTRDGWLREVAEWLQGHEKVMRMIASEETGQTNTRHLQITAETTVGAQQLRLDIHKRFMELRGEKSVRGQKMSCALIRTTWERSVAYCLKDDGTRYLKNVSEEELLSWRDEGLSQAKIQKKDQPSWLEQLRRECESAHALWDEDIGIVIVRAYMKKGKTIPDPFQLARLIKTLEIQLAGNTQEAKIKELVSQAIKIKDRIIE